MIVAVAQIAKVAFLGLFSAVLGVMTVGMAAQSPPTCANAAVRLTHDYAYAMGSADFSDPDSDVESGSTFRWLVNGVPTPAEEVAEHLLLHLDDSPVFEFTPSTASETGLPCQSAPLLYPNIPITDPQPPSTLLPPATTQFTLSVQSIENTTCAYSVGELVPYAWMASCWREPVDIPIASATSTATSTATATWTSPTSCKLPTAGAAAVGMHVMMLTTTWMATATLTSWTSRWWRLSGGRSVSEGTVCLLSVAELVAGSI